MGQDRPGSREVFQFNSRYIAGGTVSLNRLANPEIAFARGRGSRIWDVDGNEYIDYHAAFAPHILGHNDPDVTAAVKRALDDELSLFGSGTNRYEGRLAELICSLVPSIEQVQITNTGSEATYHAVRIARAATGRNGVILMQGGYNGWHNDVAANLMNTIEEIGPRVSPGEYKKVPISAGIPDHVLDDLHVVNFNDLDSVRWVMERHSIALVILEPILQNIGVVKPLEGYLQGLRKLCDEFGALLVFDEVKTGFRASLGGYQAVCGVKPDLTVLGKAVANGYPLGVIGGKKEYMRYFYDVPPKERVLIAGTYNAHPIPTVAAIATLEKLSRDGGAVYERLEELGARMERGLQQAFAGSGVPTTVSRQGSAFVLYFMDHAPRDWHDIREHHDFQRDVAYRHFVIDHGIYHFPVATKQGSISAAHTEEDIDKAVEAAAKFAATIR